jgi:inorganic triphosphatase YgiF
LLAISENVSAAAKKTDDLSSLREQLRDFIEVYPEYKDEQLLADLDAVLKTSVK